MGSGFRAGCFLSAAALSVAFAQAPPQTCNVRSFGAAGDGAALDSPAINNAIASCAAGGGGTVYVPPGIYLSGTVRLRDNITLWLDSGATLRGTRDLAQYETAVPGQSWYQALILAKGAHNVTIAGRGTIDGNKVRNPKGEERMRGPHALLLHSVTDVSVQDVFIQDAGNYALILRSAQRVDIRGITVRGGWDGINMHDTRSATISGCRISSGDDSLAGAHWENVSVSNCVLNSSANAIRTGGRNVLFNNLVIFGPGEFPAGTSQRHRLEAGFQILPHRAQSPNGGEGRIVTPGPIDNMVISNVTMVNVGTPIFIAASADASYGANNLGVGRIVFQNVTATGAGLVPIYISAAPENPAASVVLNNVRISTVGGSDELQARSQGFSPFSILQAYGVYARNVRRLELTDVSFESERPDVRAAIFADGVGNLDLHRFRAPQTSGGSPLIQIAGSGEVLWDGKPAPKTEARVIDVEAAVASDPVHVGLAVENQGGAGLAEVPLEFGAVRVARRVWLERGQATKVWFLNLRRPQAGAVTLRSGSISKAIKFADPVQKPIAPPLQFFHNVTSEAKQSDGGFYVKAAGDFPLQQYGDQYGAIFRPRALGVHGSVIVKLENPDLRTNWVGRAGIIVRNDITKPGEPGGYVVLACSPAAGPSLEWDADSDGKLDLHTAFDGYTVWPHWLKLEREGDRFLGYSSTDGKAWIKLGEAKVKLPNDLLDAGMFAYRDSALFTEFQLRQ